MKGQVYAIAVGVLASRIYSINQWSLYATVIGVVALANLAGWIEGKIDARKKK